MPEGTKVERLYSHLKRQGYSVQSAVRIAQKATGLALATGKPPKNKLGETARDRKPQTEGLP